MLMRVKPWNGEEGKTPKEPLSGNSLAVQWLGLCAFTAEGQGSIPVWCTKISRGEAKKQNKKNPGHLWFLQGKHRAWGKWLLPSPLGSLRSRYMEN